LKRVRIDAAQLAFLFPSSLGWPEAEICDIFFVLVNKIILVLSVFNDKLKKSA
jgi:hypothetical protein